MTENKAKNHGSVRSYFFKRRYGLTEDRVAALLDGQGALCPVCRRAAATVVDHDHVTLAVRGVLCGDCNSGMGQLRDDPWGLRRAIEYLTGGLLGLRRAADGGYDVAVVRPRRAALDPGWDIGQIGGHDLAVLQALASGGCDDPWEADVGVAPAEVTELRFPALDLTAPAADDPVPAEPPDPAAYAVT